MQRIVERKLNFFSHIIMQYARRQAPKASCSVFGIMDGKNKRGRPKRTWTDDVVDWCNEDICTLHGLTMDRRKWRHFVKYVMDTNGIQPMGDAENARKENAELENAASKCRGGICRTSFSK